MSRRQIVIGLVALSALAGSAGFAGKASAVGTTQFTCTETFGWFLNGDCRVGSTGHFTHQEFAAGTPTELFVNMFGSGIYLRVPKLFGIESELEATGIEQSGTENVLQNSAGPPMTTSGTTTLKYTGVTIKKPANCKVPGGSLTTKALKFTSIIGEGAKNTGLKFEPVTGEVLAVIKFENNGGTCALNGLSVNLNGRAIGAPDGAVVSFGAEGEELTVAGNPAALTQTLTFGGLDTSIPGDWVKPLSMTTTAS